MRVWAGRAFGWRRAVCGFGLAGLCFGGWLAGGGWLSGGGWMSALVTVALFGAALAALLWAGAMAHLGVVMSAYSVQVRHGLLPAPVVTVPLRSVRNVAAVQLDPTVWRRWGWTWSPRVGREVVVRSGPALALTLHSGRQVVVSVDDPAAAVAAFRRLRGVGAGSRAMPAQS